MRPLRGLVSAFPLLLLVALIFSGCGDDKVVTPQPDPLSDDGAATFEGDYDGLEGLTLQRVEITADTRVPIVIELVATNIVHDPSAGRLSADVSIRNASRATLYTPARLFIGSLVPESVRVANADGEVRCDSLRMRASAPFDRCEEYRYVFDYSETFPEGTLLPGQRSRPRTWVFEGVPADSGFSFGVHALIALLPTRTTLGGRVFVDEDRDGIADPDEGPAFGGHVRVRYPNGETLTTPVNERGHWAVPVDEPGLYEALHVPPPTFGFAPIYYSTPNPLQVLLPPDASGGAAGFDHADFGLFWGPLPDYGRVELTRVPPDSIPTSFYHLLDVGYRHTDPADSTRPALEFLVMRVGFSGCSEDHPFQLFAGANFLRDPERTWIRLSHDDRGELCDAYFERTLRFDLQPLRARQLELDGEVGPFLLTLKSPDGTLHRIHLP